MARTFSLNTLSSLNAQDAGGQDQVVLGLVTLDHPSGSPFPFRFVANNEDILSRGNTYKAAELGGKLPDESSEGELPVVEAFIRDIDRSIIAALRSLDSTRSGRATFLLEVIVSGDPDTVFAKSPLLRVLQSQVDDEHSITLRMQVADLAGEQFPGFTFTPQDFPGLF